MAQKERAIFPKKREKRERKNEPFFDDLAKQKRQ